MGWEAEEFLEGVIIYYIVSCLAEPICINFLVSMVADLKSKLIYLHSPVCHADWLCIS
jgi:hypothetical protein